MSNFVPSLKYAWLTIKHKYFVFVAGRRLGVPICQLLVHDLSKFSLKELPHYGRQFFGQADDSTGFARAWLHHQNHNAHHWEYWIPRTTHNRSTDEPLVPYAPMKMPERYAREMAADWLAASRTYGGHWPIALDTWEWYRNNFENMVIHEDTKEFIAHLLEEHFRRRR